MKITFFMLLVLVTAVHAEGMAQKVTLSMQEENIEKLFAEITKQTDIQFLYSNEVVRRAKPVTIQVRNADVNDVLREVTTRQNMTYRVIEGTVTVNVMVQPVKQRTEPLRPVLQEEIQVTGAVTGPDGAPLQGATINLKGTQRGTTTNEQGQFSITVPPQGTLVISYVGHLSQEVAVNGRTSLSVTLAEDAQALGEVVVTALGIERTAKSLGYSTVQVDGEQIAENRTNTTMGALQGKVSGVNITTLGTGPQGSTRIRIRGNSSFTGTNTPLIVINGVPIDNSRFGGQGLNNSDGGDGFSSINADDIESMTVLKGAAAAALYGSRAKDGVIMITTKLKGEGRGIGVDYNVNYTMDTPLDFTDFQYEYGQGERGVRPTEPFPTSGIWSFGEKIEPGMTQVLFDGVEVPYEPVRDRIRKFYNVGQNLTNSLALSNGGENGGFNLSLSNTDNKSIVPNSDFNRKTVNLGFTQTIFKKLTVQGNVNYSNEYNRNPAQVGGQEFSTPSSVLTLANTMPLDLLKEYRKDEMGNEVVYARFLPRTNPYFSVYEKFENIKRDRFIGNILLKYDFTDWLYVQGRIAQDFYVRNQDFNYPTGYAAIGPAPAGFVNGSYFMNNRRFRERNYDFLLGADREFGEFDVNLTLGGNQMYRRFDQENQSVQDFIERGLYTIMNGRVKSSNYSVSERKVNSLYGAAEVSFRDYLFVNVTARNDWFSTLAPGSRSILYPSVTGSFVFTDALGGMPEWLNFGKLRLAYAEVGDDNVDPYSNALYYQVNNNLFPNPQGSMIPVGGINTNTIPNGLLRPLRVSEMEAGVELRLFNNVLGLDVAYYHKVSRDQIVSAQISNTTGYTSQLINVGRSMNRGIETAITASPVRTGSFNWDINANLSYNTSKVLQLGLTEEDDMITVGGIRQVVGMPMGQIYEYLYLRDEQGRQVFDKNSGFPLRTAEMVNVGTNQPSYFGGITNMFNYKGITLSALVDFKLGKDYILVGGSNRNYWRHGLHKGTLPGRDVGYVIGDGVNPDGSINETRAEVQPYYESITSQNIHEPFIYNAGFWKLRQVSMGYDFTKHLPSTFWVKGIRLSLVANNVAVLKKWTENMDPEELYDFAGNSTGSGWSSLPLTRSVGFNLNVKF